MATLDVPGRAMADRQPAQAAEPQRGAISNEHSRTLFESGPVSLRMATSADFNAIASVAQGAYRCPGTREYAKDGSLPQAMTARALELKTKLGGADVMIAEVGSGPGKKIVGYRVASYGAMAVPANDEEWAEEIAAGAKVTDKLQKAGKLGPNEAVLSKANLGTAKNRWLWDEVVIDPAFRDTGIAELLWAKTVRQAQAQNVISISSEIDPKNTRSLRFHQQTLGMKITEEHSSTSLMTVEGREAKVRIKWCKLAVNPGKIDSETLEAFERRAEQKLEGFLAAQSMSKDELLRVVSSSPSPFITNPMLKSFIAHPDSEKFEVLEAAAKKIMEVGRDSDSIATLKKVHERLRALMRAGNLPSALRPQVGSLVVSLSAAAEKTQ